MLEKLEDVLRMVVVVLCCVDIVHQLKSKGKILLMRRIIYGTTLFFLQLAITIIGVYVSGFSNLDCFCALLWGVYTMLMIVFKVHDDNMVEMQRQRIEEIQRLAILQVMILYGGEMVEIEDDFKDEVLELLPEENRND